ncbi:MAG: hypothetical protein FIA98_12830 [Anaerolineae bacterium]|nr:hypothetical protein [Anaerolineae bacterium]
MESGFCRSTCPVGFAGIFNLQASSSCMQGRVAQKCLGKIASGLEEHQTIRNDSPVSWRGNFCRSPRPVGYAGIFNKIVVQPTFTNV